MAPGAHQERADDDERDIGKDRNAEGDGHVKPHAELAGYLDLPESPGDEGTDRADGDQLPDAAIGHRSELQSIFDRGRINADQPGIPGAFHRGAQENERGSEEGKEKGRHAEEADEERADPEVEQVSADQRASPDPVFSFKVK
jgi:hypothetical protein